MEWAKHMLCRYYEDREVPDITELITSACHADAGDFERRQATATLLDSTKNWMDQTPGINKLKQKVPPFDLENASWRKEFEIGMLEAFRLMQSFMVKHGRHITWPIDPESLGTASASQSTPLVRPAGVVDCT